MLHCSPNVAPKPHLSEKHMNETLPKVIADYLKTSAGQTMLDGAAWFRWNLKERRVEVSGSETKLSSEKMSMTGTLVFMREGKGWRRYA